MSALHHGKVQRITGDESIILHTPEVTEYIFERQAQATIIFTAFASAKISLTVSLEGEEAHATVIGIVGAKDNMSVEIETLQAHHAPATTSSLLVKSVATDEAHVLYAGSIYVAPKAQKTDAYQRNENLLLSPSVVARTKPGLEILANDVRCTHGATVGTIDDEQLWYLLSRGIQRSQAIHAIAGGFLSSALPSEVAGSIRDSIESDVWQQVSTLVQ